jgi:hypothetical protein
MRRIEPYLDWVLADVDTASNEVLIRNPSAGINHPHKRDFVILRGRLVELWLQRRRSAFPF